MPARRSALVFSLGLGSLFVGGWLVFGGELGARRAPSDRSAKRLVVLPFVNLGPADRAYFADGVTDELTARLGMVDSLRVIASTSARGYRETRKAMSEVGKELGVDYVLEGSVRWQQSAQDPPRVRVTPQLVSTRDGTHLWAEVYDEPLDEIFRIQSDIARKVAQALDMALLEPQRGAPTSSLEAYQYYLQGNDLNLRLGTEERPTRSSLRLYEKAVELDPNFALAHAMLSRAHSRMYWMYYDRSENRRALAKRAIDKAFELEPGLAEAHHSLGTYYMGNLEYDRALREFAIAEAKRPNASNVFLARAALRTRQGKLREALVEYEKAEQLDPASSIVASNHGQPYELLRNFPRAEDLYDRAIALAPDRSYPYFLKASMYLRWDGSTARARAVLAEAPASGVTDQVLLVYTRILVEILDRRYQQAIDLLSWSAPDVIADQFRFIPKVQLLAQIYGLLQRSDVERAYYDLARNLVYRKVQEQPEDPRLRSALGIAYAGLGLNVEAIQQGRLGVELLPISKEAYRGYYRAWDLARIYAMVGNDDAAIDQLESLLSHPGNLTSAALRTDPVWDPLRRHHRFQQLVRRGT